jgi:restriction endonuclease Mrr
MASKLDVPKYDALMQPIVDGLKALGGSSFNQELHDWVADHLGLSDEVRAVPHGNRGMTVLQYRLVSFHVLFQCKRWKSSVGPAVVRDFRGAMVGRADKGLILTTASFKAEARREATRDGAPAIDLVDGEALCGLLRKLGLGVRVRVVEEVEVNPDFFNGL